MLSRILVVVAAAAALAGAETAEEAGSDREGKFSVPHMFHIVTFDNGPCQAQNGEHGTCFSQKECDELKGSVSGKCANGFGVCCILKATCGETISVNNTYFINSIDSTTSATRSTPTHVSPYGSSGHVSYSVPTTCFVTVEPPEGTCQILLQFDEFEMAGPTEGDCNNDTFVVHGANAGSEIPTLCGNNAGQHMYIDVDNSAGPFMLATTTSYVEVLRRWKIKVSFIDAHNPCKAPNRCLQYYKDTSGSFKSFNYIGKPPMMLNNQNYAICFAYVPGYCDIGITYTRYDLGDENGECTGDYTGMNNHKLCGDFESLSTMINATSPMTIQVVSDDSNEREEEGFHANYMMMACH
ncbi:uncharacterized protein LOC127006338 [Eriocheir sinensis]|uniref:uncharacterized protein LOC127006338 n=1 Tax=Eriocheir sinensis TaxID=95602 RepID=UPI0021C7011D|nr:uncharacterized protein LOC127006338 [Eriocheir sinensis]XP_050732125.1 uncharacterized protein LOC127006338 [Eriocheir sinensis]